MDLADFPSQLYLNCHWNPDFPFSIAQFSFVIPEPSASIPILNYEVPMFQMANEKCQMIYGKSSLIPCDVSPDR